MAKGGGLTEIDMNLCSGVGLWYNEWAAEERVATVKADILPCRPGQRTATRTGRAKWWGRKELQLAAEPVSRFKSGRPQHNCREREREE